MEIEIIQQKIHLIRNCRVMLDYDLAALYGTETKRLKEAVRRNVERFPEDFMFELTWEELQSLRTQFASLKSSRGQHPKYLPFAFTEHGVAMLSGVLNTPKAIQTNIAIFRAFVAMRHFAVSYADLAQRLALAEKGLEDVNEVLTWLAGENQSRADEIAALGQNTTGWENRQPIGFKTGKN